MEIRFQPQLAPVWPQPVRSAGKVPEDTVEFRRPGPLGLWWRSATREQVEARLREGKTVQVKDGSWVPVEQTDDLAELDFFRGQSPQAPSDMGSSLKSLAAAGGRFTSEAELGPYGAYHELEQGRPVTLTIEQRTISLQNPAQVAMAAYFHDLHPAPTPEAETLKTLYHSGLELGGSPVDPPRPVQVTTRDGVPLLTVEDLTVPVTDRLTRVTERWERLQSLKERAPEAMRLLGEAPPEHEAALTALCQGSSKVPAALYRRVCQDPTELAPALEALNGCEGDEARALEFMQRCRAEGDPISAKALLLSQQIGEYSALARLKPEQLEPIEQLAALKEPVFKAGAGWQQSEEGAWSFGRYRDNEDSAVELPAVQLGQGSRLELTERHALESNCDFLRVEVRPAGQKWQSLANYTGRAGWQSRTCDLSAFDGQKVELRLRLTSDHSNSDEGVAVRDLRLITGGRVVQTTERGPATLAELVKLAPPAPELSQVVADARACGLGPALALHRAGATGLGELAGQIGLAPALALRDVPERAAGARELALRLAPGRPEAEQLQLAHQLADKQVDAAPYLELERGLETPADWQAEGSWKVEETREGRVWRHGRYPDNASHSLTTPEFECGKETRLSYRVASNLEANCDFVRVEARVGDGWRELRRHTGNAGWSAQEIDLSELAGQKTRLRFRLTSDHSNSGDGLSLAGIRVVADGRRVLAFDEGAAGHAELEQLALANDPRRLGAVQELARQTGSTAAALSLEGKASGPLAALVGVGPAQKLGDLALPPEQLGAAWNAAARLQDSFQQPTDLEARIKLTRQLAGSDVSAAQLQRLASVPSGVGWQPEAGWTQVRENDAQVWRRSYKDNEDSSLISPELDLTHVHGARALFEHRYELEANCDFVGLEAREAGSRDWVTLRRFTGRSGLTDEVVDLSAFDGKKIQLRFRLTSDHSNVSDGYHLGSVLVNGLTDLRPGARLDEAVQKLTDLPADRRDAALDELERAARRLGSREAALALWPDLSEPRQKLMETLGMPAALAHAGDADRLVECFEVARRLCHENGESASRERLLQLAEKLLAADLAPAELTSLAALTAQKPPVWSMDAPWEARRGAYGFGRYKDNADASLRLPPLDLTGLKEARVQFELEQNLEQNCDFISLEARSGGSWTTLGRWTGRQSWRERDLDLSAFDGQKLELRLRLTSDHSNSGEGAEVRALRVRARAEGEALPRTLAQMPEGNASASDLIELVTAQPKASRPAMLAELSRMSGKLESAAGACQLWPEAAHDPEAVTELARALGLERARQLAPMVQSQDDVARLIGLYESSWRLSMAMGAPPPDADRLALVSQLMPLGVKAEPLARLTELVRASEAAPPGVQAEAPWKREMAPGRGMTYGTGRYPDKADASLTLPPHGSARKLRFELRYGLEEKCDFLSVEGRSGGKWTELARFTGQGNWKLHELDLAGCEQVRFRLTSDHSNSGEGVELGMIEAGSFRYDPTPVRWDALGQVLANGTLPQVEALARDERLAGALEMAAACTPSSDLEAVKATYRLTRSWGYPPAPERVGEILRAAGAEKELVQPLSQLPARNAWRVLQFIQEKQAPGGPLEAMSLREALESYLAVAVNEVLVDDLDQVLELMLTRQAASIGEKDQSVIIGGVVVKKKEA